MALENSIHISELPLETNLDGGDSLLVENGVSTRRVNLQRVSTFIKNEIKALYESSDGIIGVEHGGTGLNASPSMLTNLGSNSAADIMQASPRPGVTGTLPVANGGTGTTDGTLNGVKLATETTGGTTKYGYKVGNTFHSFRQPTGNATAGDVLSGKTFANSSSDSVSGTMANQGAKTASLNAGGSYTIPAGYHNGSGVVSANSLSSQTPGDAGSNTILDGKVAWVNGVRYTGRMANYENDIQTVAPTEGTGEQTLVLPSGYHTAVVVDRTEPYNAGVYNAQNISWFERIYFKATGQLVPVVTNKNIVSNLVAELPIRNVNYISVYMVNANRMHKLSFLNGAGVTISVSDNIPVGRSLTIPNNACYLKVELENVEVTATDLDNSVASISIDVTYVAKLLR